MTKSSQNVNRRMLPRTIENYAYAQEAGKSRYYIKQDHKNGVARGSQKSHIHGDSKCVIIAASCSSAHN